MPFLQVTLTPPTTQVTLPNISGNTKLVVVPLSVTTNPSLIFDAVPNVSIPLYAGVIFEYDAEFPIQNFKFQNGTSGDIWLLYFSGNSDGSGIHYILTQGSSVNANITNGSLNVNASGTVNANVTNSTLNTNANITNSSLNVNANVTNATLNANITNSTINETINGQNIVVTTTNNNFAGQYYSTINSFSLSTAGNYLAVLITVPSGGYIRIKNVHFFSSSSLSNFQLFDDYGQITNMWNALNFVPIELAGSTTLLVKGTNYSFWLPNSGSSGPAFPIITPIFSMNVDRVYYNSTNSNVQLYYKMQVSATSSSSITIAILIEFENGNSSWFSNASQNTGGGGTPSGGGSGGGGKYPT